ncbi:MAG: DnaJ domain-containing protein [Thermodesulfobacteriota bacterium]|nr:DnaJ domain-containing protein [Thermodesulfobacteriota bacterium]
MKYRQDKQPGCGGCFLIFLLWILLFGGAPLLLKFVGIIFFGVLFLVFSVVAAFWGFSYYINRRVSEYEQSQTESHKTFVFLLVNILVKVAQFDNVITREKTNAIYRFFQYNLNYSYDQLLWVKELIKESRKSSVDLETMLIEFKSEFAYEPRLILVELIYQVIFTHDRVPEQQLDLARKIADFLEISAYDLQAIQSRYFARYRQAPADESRYYQTLGLQPGAGMDEIKKAYRELSMKYHPDKVEHLGEEFRKVAEEKMKDLNLAYQFLKKKMG